MGWIARQIWIIRSFEREFGFSDVQSNYSRLYAWMANQLGHMAIGFFTALIFVWVAEGAALAARDYHAYRLTGSGPADWPAVLFTAVVLIAIFAIPALNIAGASKTPVSLGHFVPIPSWPARLINAAFILGAAYAAYRLNGAFLAMEPAAMEAASINLGYFAATLLVAAITLMLAEDLSFLILAALALAATLLVATKGYGLDEATLSALYLALMAAFAIVAGVSLLTRQLGFPAPNMSPQETVVQAAVILILVLAFHQTIAQGLSDAWREAAAASIAAVTLWWVKEFAADLPKVAAEVAAARARRPIAVTGEGARLEQEYLDDARIDSRTDGMFYLAGAIIAAGVLSDAPLFAEFGWRSGVEVAGVLIFILILYGVGEVWADRQEALDQIGVARASRLAVFSSALKLGPAPGEGEAFAPMEDPISVLGAFAQAEDPGARAFDHIILFARPGAGMRLLGRAVVSEAALSAHATALGASRTDGEERTGRFIARNALINQRAELRERGDMMAAPTQPFWAPLDDGDPILPEDEAPPNTRYRLRRHASVVAVSELLEIGPYTPDHILANLSVEKGQQILWLMHPENEIGDTFTGFTEAEAEAWRPDYEDIRHRVDLVQNAIEKRSPGARIGVGFVARMKPEK